MSFLPAESYIAPVTGTDDLFSFAIPMEAKALDNGDTVSVDENGDLIIEGYAAVWEGEDREGENFAPGAFERATKAFLESPAALCFHHKRDQVLGKVLDLREDGKGLKMKARVDGAIKTHPVLGTYYHQVKNGTLSGLSVGGFFKRAIIEGKQKIADMDFTEISVTGVPVHAKPSFAVVAGKALDGDTELVPSVDDDGPTEAEVVAAFARVTDRFGAVADAKALPDAHDPQAASHVHELITHLGRARSAATFAKDNAEHKGLKNAADALETDLIAHEKKMHKLAAKVGPLPPTY